MSQSEYDASQFDVTRELSEFSVGFSRLVTQISFVLRDKPDLADELLSDTPPFDELEYLLRMEYRDEVAFAECLPEVLNFGFRMSVVEVKDER